MKTLTTILLALILAAAMTCPAWAQTKLATSHIIGLVIEKSDNPFKNGWLALALTTVVILVFAAFYTFICFCIPGVNKWYKVVGRLIFLVLCISFIHYCIIKSI